MILYNKDKKAYVNYVEQKLRSDIVTDISLASIRINRSAGKSTAEEMHFEIERF